MDYTKRKMNLYYFGIYIKHEWAFFSLNVDEYIEGNIMKNMWRGEDKASSCMRMTPTCPLGNVWL